MKTILLLLSIVGAIAAFTIPNVSKQREEIPSGIINGTKASISDYSYLATVNLKMFSWSLLTGSGLIVSPRWVLTAALSVYDQATKDLEIRVGSSSAIEGGKVVQVSKIVVHPAFNRTTLANDVALIRLAENLTLSENVTIAPITSTQPKLNQTVVVAGFGLALTNVSDAEETLWNLRTVNVTVDHLPDSQSNDTRVIRTRDTYNGGPTNFDWGSPLIDGGSVVGLYIGNTSWPSALRNKTTTDSFVDLTQDKLWVWVAKHLHEDTEA